MTSSTPRRTQRQCSATANSSDACAFWSVRNPCWTNASEARRRGMPAATRRCSSSWCGAPDSSDGSLEAYLRHMMLVMDFDVRRRGRLVSASGARRVHALARDRRDRSDASLHRQRRCGASRRDALSGCLGRAHPPHAPRHLRGPAGRLLQRPAGSARGPFDRARRHPQRRVPRLGGGPRAASTRELAMQAGRTSRVSRARATGWRASPTSRASSG